MELNMSKMNWNKAKKPKQIEEKYKQGSVLPNGRLVYSGPRDSLEARARAAERKWSRKAGRP